MRCKKMKNAKVLLGLIIVLVLFPLASSAAWGESKSITQYNSTEERWSNTIYYTAFKITDDEMGDYGDYSPRVQIEITDATGQFSIGNFTLYLFSGSKYDLEHNQHTTLDQFVYGKGKVSFEWKINETGDYAVGFKETSHIVYEAWVVITLWYWVGERTTTTTPLDTSSQESNSDEATPLNPVLVPYFTVFSDIFIEKKELKLPLLSFS